jgi:hypothetical protein
MPDKEWRTITGMSQMTPEQLENHADALEFLNTDLTESLVRQADSGQRCVWGGVQP